MTLPCPKNADANTNPSQHNIFVGCAGWSIPREQASQFAPEEGSHSGSSHIARYSQHLPAVEINSSFYRSHKSATYARWAASVPEHFRFSVKLPRQITHFQKLRAPEEMLDRFLSEVEALGKKLGPILVQLPPSLVFEEAVAEAFFQAVRMRFEGFVVCEPRHPSWFHLDAERMMEQFRVARVATDPVVPVPEAAKPGGWQGVLYYRLHGSPRIYYSDYPQEYLATMAQTLIQEVTRASPKVSIVSVLETAWCIFDNTAVGAATANALSVLDRLRF